MEASLIPDIESDVYERNRHALRAAGEYTASIRLLLKSHSVRIEPLQLDELLSDAFAQKYEEALSEAEQHTEPEVQQAKVIDIKEALKNSRKSEFLSKAFAGLDLSNLQAGQIDSIFNAVIEAISAQSSRKSIGGQVSRLQRWADGATISEIAKEDWVTTAAVSITKTSLIKKAGKIVDIHELMARLGLGETEQGPVAETDSSENNGEIVVEAEQTSYESLRDVVFKIRDAVLEGRDPEGEFTDFEDERSEEIETANDEPRLLLPEDFEEKAISLIDNSPQPVHIGFLTRQFFSDRLPREEFKTFLDAINQLCRGGKITYLGNSMYGSKAPKQPQETINDTLASGDAGLVATPQKSLSKMLHEAGIHDRARPARRRAAKTRKHSR